MEKVQSLLQEAIRVLSDIPSAQDLLLAKKTWGTQAQTTAGQKQIIQAAKIGDITAINFLFDALRPQIASALWKNFLGKDNTWRKKRIEQGDPYVFASLGYVILLASHLKRLPIKQGQALVQQNLQKGRSTPVSEDSVKEIYDDIVGTPSPLDTFDARKYTKPGTNIIEKFGWYLGNALASEAVKYNKLERRSGIVGKISKTQTTEPGKLVSSYEDYVETTPEVSGAMSQDIKDIENLNAWEGFCKDRQLDRFFGGQAPTVRTILKDVILGLDVNQIAQKHHVTNQTIRSRLSVLGELLKEHGLQSGDFSRLLRIYGKQKLSSML